MIGPAGLAHMSVAGTLIVTNIEGTKADEALRELAAELYSRFARGGPQ